MTGRGIGLQNALQMCAASQETLLATGRSQLCAVNEFERFRIKHAIRETYLHVFKRILAEKAINRLIVRQTWSMQGLDS